MVCLAWRLCGPETWSDFFDFLMFGFPSFWRQKILALSPEGRSFGVWGMVYVYPVLRNSSDGFLLIEWNETLVVFTPQN